MARFLNPSCVGFLAALVTLAGAVSAETVTVFAAASTRNALDAVADAYEAESGDAVTRVYAGTSALARQITQGAPADVFLSANPDWMDYLGQEGHVAEGTRFDLLGNSLVLVGAMGTGADPVEVTASFDILGRLNGGRLAMALVEAVPAGIYGKAALQSLDQWQALAPHVAQSDNVRAALALVALGEAPLGIVYATDAVAEPRVTVIGTFPATAHPPIRYPVAAVGEADPATQAFLTFLGSDAARSLFEAQGFTVLAD